MAVQKYVLTIITLYEEKAFETDNRQIKALLSTLIERFRQHIRTYDSKAHSASHSAFTTEGGEESEAKTKTPTLKGKTKEIPECFCGSKYYWSTYNYLRSDRPGKSSGFKLNTAIKKKVDDAFNNNADLKVRITKAMENARLREKERKSGSKDLSPSSNKKPLYNKVYIVLGSTFAVDTISLYGFWIVDYGFDSYIYNTSIIERFILERKYEQKLSLRAGNDGNLNPIVGWGRIDILV